MNNVRIHRPVLSRSARYRWDTIRQQHQIVFPEGVLVLNETAAAIVKCCDGRTAAELVSAIERQFPGDECAVEVRTFLSRLAEKGLLGTAAEDAQIGQNDSDPSS